MKRLIVIIVISFLSKVFIGQTTDQLIGRWTLQYSLQSNQDSCNLPKERGILDFSSSGTYSWDVNGGIIKGKWKIIANKIRLYNNRAINFEATVADLLYPIELTKGFLVIHQPEGGDISCPHLYYKKK
jgi:hypothetical protein